MTIFLMQTSKIWMATSAANAKQELVKLARDAACQFFRSKGDNPDVKT